MITVFGDSLSVSGFGISFKQYLAGDIEFRGVMGQGILKIIKRAEEYLPQAAPDEIIVIEGGGNDVLEVSKKWGCLPPRKPAGEVDFDTYRNWELKMSVRNHTVEFLEKDGFEAILSALMARQTEAAARIKALGRDVIVCSTAVISEDPLSLFNRLCSEWNSAMRRDFGQEAYLDMCSPILPLLKGRTDFIGGTLAELNADSMIIDGSEQKAMELAADRGFGGTIDGVHMNTAAARAVAKAWCRKFPLALHFQPENT